MIKHANIEFIESLSSKQQDFFDSLGIDLTKIEVDKFMIKGKILALPKYQKEIYSDEEVFGENFPSDMKVLSSNDDD